MKRVSLAIVISLLTGALLVAEVQAKRLGGGSSVGRQSSTVTQRSAAPAPQSPSGATGAAPASPAAPAAAPGAPAQAPAAAARPAPAATPAAAPAPARNRWLGPLAGIAAGIGLAALASHFGFGEELASFMLIGLLVFAVLIAVRLFMARRAMSQNPQPAWQGAGAGSGAVPAEPAAVDYGRRPEPVLAPLPSELSASTPASAASGTLPADFDVETFLKGARAQFTRLQAAFDAGDTTTLSEFTTADMARELRAQIEARGAQPSRTDVVRLDADVLGLESDSQEHLISVRFHGLIREEQDAPAQDFDEVWNLTKPVDGRSGWVLAGIQQMH